MLMVRRGRERGQVLTLAAVLLALVLLPLMALVADLVAVQSESSRAAAASFVGATAAAQSVEVAGSRGALRTGGQLRLSGSAVDACRRAAAVVDPGAQIRCTPTGARLAIRVTKRVDLPVSVLGFGWTVSAQASGGPQVGTLRAW